MSETTNPVELIRQLRAAMRLDGITILGFNRSEMRPFIVSDGFVLFEELGLLESRLHVLKDMLVKVREQTPASPEVVRNAGSDRAKRRRRNVRHNRVK